MSNFAALNGEQVVNTIIADSKELAEQVTGKICVEFTNEPAELGGTYVNGVFITKKPYPSWVIKNQSWWEAPVPAPTFNPENPKQYAWDELTLSWIEIN
jgi:hypothetical protein